MKKWIEKNWMFVGLGAFFLFLVVQLSGAGGCSEKPSDEPAPLWWGSGGPGPPKRK